MPYVAGERFDWAHVKDWADDQTDEMAADGGESASTIREDLLRLAAEHGFGPEDCINYSEIDKWFRRKALRSVSRPPGVRRKPS